jgi:hypothetical protein
MVFLTLPWLLWWALWTRRWRVWLGFGGTLAGLLGLSLLLMPNWPLRFLWSLNEYGSYTAIGSPLRIIADLLWPTAAPTLELIGILLLGSYGLFCAWRWRQARGLALDWLTGLTLAMTSFVAPRTATTNQVVLILPLALALRSLPARRRSMLTGTILAFLLIVPWLVFLTTIQAREEHPIAYVPLPLIFTLWFIVTHRRIEGNET